MDKTHNEVRDVAEKLIQAIQSALESEDDAKVPRLILDASERFNQSVRSIFDCIKYDPDERDLLKKTITDEVLLKRRASNHHKKRDIWLRDAPTYRAMVEEYDRMGGYVSDVSRKYAIPINNAQACFMSDPITDEKLELAIIDRVKGHGVVEISLKRKINYMALCNHLFVDSFDEVLKRMG